MTARTTPPQPAPVVVRWIGWLSLIAFLAVASGLFPSGHASAQPPADADAGAEIYAANCAMCHGADATGMMGMHPALTGAVERLTVEGVEITIRNGRQTMPPMPAFAGRLSDREIADVIAYLDSLPSGPRNFGPDMGPDGMMGDRDMRDMMDRMMGDRGMMGGMMGGWGWLFMLVPVLLIVLLVAVLALLINQRGTQARRGDGRGGEDARAVLDRRYAAGELSREQYRQAREDLDG